MRVLFGDSYLSLNGGDDIYKVRTYIPGQKLKKGEAYINGDYVFPYRGKYKDKESIEVGVYKDKNIGDYFVDSYDMSDYTIEKIVNLDTGIISDIIAGHKEQFSQPEDLEIINNNAEIYVPTVKDSDDFLKYLVKSIIVGKKINLRNYKHKFPNEYALNNMKSGLNRATKMTVTNFKAWCEILGVDWEIRVTDSGNDTTNPLDDDIVISSDEF